MSHEIRGMSHERKILLIVLGALAIAGLLFSLWYFGNEGTPSEDANIWSDAAQDEIEEESKEEKVEEEYPEGVPETPQPKVLIEVTEKDCAEECRAFPESEKKSYCRSYCGLSQVEGQTPAPAGSCEDKKNIERDQCLKDEAVRKKDINRCNDIYDQGLKKSCQARVTEDYFP